MIKHLSFVLRIVLVLIGLGLAALGTLTLMSLNEQKDEFSSDTCEPAQLPIRLNIMSDLDSTFISWYKRWPNECQATYQLRYTINDVEEVEVNTTEVFYKLSRLEACSSLLVRLWVIHESGEQTGNYIIGKYIEEPVSLGPVQNFEVCVCRAKDATISWDTPAYATQCTDLNYIVAAENENDISEILCNGKETCSLTLQSFCPYTNLTIRESTGIGEELSVTYVC